MGRVLLASLLAASVAASGCDGAARSGGASTAGATAAAATAGVEPPAPTLEGGAVFAGRVTCDGQPVEDALLVVTDLRDGLVPESLAPGSLITGSGGAFSLDLAPGRYRVWAAGPEAAFGEALVDVPSAAPFELAIAPDPDRVRRFVETGRLGPGGGAE